MKNSCKNTSHYITSVIFFLIVSVSAFAQNGVRIAGTSGTADPSAMLDVVSTNKGVLFPRVCLASLTANSSPVTNPQAGLVIYNTGACGIPTTGLYFWNGSAWVFLNTGGFTASGIANQVAKFTASNAIGNSIITDDGTNVGIGTSSISTAFLNILTPNLATNSSSIRISPLGGGTSAVGRNSIIDFWSTFDNYTADQGPRRTASIKAGFNNGAWGNEYLSFRVGTGAGNDAAVEPNERMRITGAGNVQINGLAGTGYRPVYASANGTLATTFPTVTVFSYTGADQTYVVPAGVTSITVKMWGAGGGGGYYGGWTSGFSGGGGGFTQGNIAVSPGQSYTIVVGGGGTGGNVANTNPSYGGGARSCNTGSDCRYGAQGGGRSAIRLSGTELLTAGGGGGGGSSRGNSMASYGGAGGGMVGQDGTNDQYNYGGGRGGFPTAGGFGGCQVTACGSQGAQFAGGNPSSNSYGGGGGGGWWGGGGGGYNESNTMAGGGGGSGYIGGAGVSNAFTVTGNFIQPAQMWDVYYATGIGVGGLTIYQSTPLTGGNGRVVIIQN